MIRHTLFAITLGLIIFFLYLFQYTGAFKSVTVAEDWRGPYTVVYLDHIGAYHKIVEKIEVVESWAHKNGLQCRLSFGQYFDDPRIVEEGRLTSRGGCLIDDKSETEKFEQLKKNLPPDFKTDVIPKTRAVVALFTGAAGIGPLKVYPKAEDYISEHELQRKESVIEIYEIFSKNAMQTTYIWPIQD